MTTPLLDSLRVTLQRTLDSNGRSTEWHRTNIEKAKKSIENEQEKIATAEREIMLLSEEATQIQELLNSGKLV